MESLLTPSRASEDPNAAVWNEVTFVWDQPDPNGWPGFWRLGQSIDEDGFSTEFVYGDANDPTAASELWELSPGGDPNDPSVQPGSVNPFPTTGWGTHYRSYWRHAPFERSGWPMERAFERTEASAAPYTGGIERDGTEWRWRFHWVIPPFGAHVGIDYYRYDDLEYLDYGQPPDEEGCTCCAAPFGAYLWGVNNRYQRERTDILSRLPDGVAPSAGDQIAYSEWYGGSANTPMRSCFHWNVPRNWTDSSGTCCRWYWNGWTPICLFGLPPGCGSGNWSNSNGGIHAAYHFCRDEYGGSGVGPHAPAFWTHFTPGWSNTNLYHRNEQCTGYDTDND